jgi:PAS domain S-box-containing protein
MHAQCLNVLLIEDDPHDAGLIRNLLEERRPLGFALECADRLADGLDRLGRGGIDVALLDLGLPDSDGIDTFRAARAHAPKLPIVILAGPDEEPVAAAAVGEGAQDYLLKGPAAAGLLARTLYNAVGRKREEEALRESEQRYRRLLDSVTDYIYTVHLDGRGRPTHTTHGPACATVTGYAAEDFAVDPFLWLRMVHPDDRAAVVAQASAACAGADVAPLEHRIIHRAGPVRWVRNTVVLRRDGAGRATAYDGLISDLTERKRAEAALAASEERHRRLFEANQAGIIVSDAAGTILDCNDAFARLLGYAGPADLRGRCSWDLYFAPADRSEPLALLMSRGRLTDYELRYKDAAGRPVWVLASLTLEQADGDGPLIYATVVDITRRREAEQALRDSEALYYSLVESGPLHVFRKDLQGRFTFANERFCRSLGRPLEQVLGRTDADLFPPDLAEKYRRDDQRVVATGQVYEATETYAQADGKRAYVSVVKAPVLSARAAVVGTQGIFWDVSEGRWAEEQRAQLQVARDIQQKLLPRSAPSVPGYDIAGASFPAEATGGDYFDYVELPGGRLGVVVADVSGHGFGPALLGAATHACLRTLAQAGHPIGIDDMLAAANRLLFADTDGDPFVTLVFAHLDPAARTLIYSNAGHPPAFVLDATGEVKARLGCTGCFLGIAPEGEFPVADPVHLTPGDVVVFVTDGVLEAMSPEPGGTTFGSGRALAVVRANRHRSARDIVAALCGAALEFYQGEPQHDDLTAVVIKVEVNSK